MNIVNVRWFDGYLETFEANEVRFGNAYLFMRLIDGQNRHIPLSQVRWFSLSKESHAAVQSDNISETEAAIAEWKVSHEDICDTWTCGHCSRELCLVGLPPYCPQCGAKMQQEETQP